MSFRRVRSALAALAAFGLLAGGVTAADDNGIVSDTRYESPAHGYVVTWDDPWMVELGGTSHEPGFDILSLGAGLAGITVRGIVLDMDLAEYLDTYYIEVLPEVGVEDLEIVAQDEVDGVVYTLMTGDADPEGEMIFYTEARFLDPEDEGGAVIVHTDLMAPLDEAADLFASAVDDVAIDDEPLFLAAAEVEDEIAAVAGDERDAADDRDDDRDDDRGDDRDDRDDEADDEEEDQDGAETDDDEREPDENGLLDDDAYVSPTHGYEIVWGEGWFPDPDATTTADGVDTLSLLSAGADGEVRVLGTAAGYTSEAVVDIMVEDMRAGFPEIEIVELGVVDGVAYALLEDTSSGDPVVIYVEARPFSAVTDGDADGVVLSLLLSTGEAYERNLATAIDEIEIDGSPVFAGPIATGEAEEQDDDERDEADEDDEREEEENDEDERDDEEDDQDEDR